MIDSAREFEGTNPVHGFLDGHVTIVCDIPILPDRFVAGSGEHDGDFGRRTFVGDGELFEVFFGFGVRITAGLRSGTCAHGSDAEAKGVITKYGAFSSREGKFKFVIKDAEGTQKLNEVAVVNISFGRGLTLVRTYPGKRHGIG